MLLGKHDADRSARRRWPIALLPLPFAVSDSELGEFRFRLFVSGPTADRSEMEDCIAGACAFAASGRARSQDLDRTDAAVDRHVGFQASDTPTVTRRHLVVAGRQWQQTVLVHLAAEP